MNAAETIQAAIDRLTELRDRSGTYQQWNGGDFQDAKWVGGHGKSSYAVGTVGPLTVTIWDASEQDSAGDWRDSSAVALVQTLHRTIDAQLQILRHALADAFVTFDGHVTHNPNALELARAILGGAK